MKTKKEVNNLETNAVSDVTPKSKKKLNKKQKVIISVVSVIVVIALLVGGWYLYELNTNKWEVKQEEITIEYGETYEPELTELVDTEKYTNVTTDNTTIDFNTAFEVDLQNKEDKAYIPVGSYDISINHKVEYKLFGLILFSLDDTKTVKLNVADTVAPVFSEDVPTEVEVYKDCSIENIEETFSATDLSDVEITVDNENVDYATVGEYATNVYATDESGNVTSKEIKVIVKEPTITVDPINISLIVGENATITATIRGKEQTAVWSSSDESVATVDENGKVTAVKSGTATITAKANDVEASTTISVTNKSSSSNSSSGNRTNSNNTSSSGSNSRPSESSSSSKPNSSSSNSNSSSGNETVTHCTNNNNHSSSCGNLGSWYNNKSEIEKHWNTVRNELIEEYNKGNITWEEYISKVPSGYECWSCSYCGKLTGNFKYR